MSGEHPNSIKKYHLSVYKTAHNNALQQLEKENIS